MTRLAVILFHFLLGAAALAPGAVAAADLQRRIQYSDVDVFSRDILRQWGIKSDNFDSRIQSIIESTAKRELKGEIDHLIYYILQSGRFTNLPRIEPSLSARDLVGRLRPLERQKYLQEPSFQPPTERTPRDASERIMAFVEALERPSSDERMAYFRSFLKTVKPSTTPLFKYLCDQYAQSMRFLFQKEFSPDKSDPAPASVDQLATLYQHRGHSTDTQIEANFVVHLGLEILKARSPDEKINNVLVIGPGLDFAPRTELIDLFNPQIYQPFALIDSLLGLRLSDLGSLRVHCVDINDRVVRHLLNLRSADQVQLSILSGLPDATASPFSADFKSYFAQVGSRIGDQSRLENIPAQYRYHLSKKIRVRAEVVRQIDASLMNVITERIDPSPGYDLVVVTNVFPYFSDPDLLLALSNIESMLRPGGYLFHNEARASLLAFSKAQGLPLMFSRTALIAGVKGASLYDGVWVHRSLSENRLNGSNGMRCINQKQTTVNTPKSRASSASVRSSGARSRKVPHTASTTPDMPKPSNAVEMTRKPK